MRVFTVDLMPLTRPTAETTRFLCDAAKAEPSTHESCVTVSHARRAACFNQFSAALFVHSNLAEFIIIHQRRHNPKEEHTFATASGGVVEVRKTTCSGHADNMRLHQRNQSFF